MKKSEHKANLKIIGNLAMTVGRENSDKASVSARQSQLSVNNKAGDRALGATSEEEGRGGGAQSARRDTGVILESGDTKTRKNPIHVQSQEKVLAGQTRQRVRGGRCIKGAFSGGGVQVGKLRTGSVGKNKKKNKKKFNTIWAHTTHKKPHRPEGGPRILHIRKENTKNT